MNIKLALLATVASVATLAVAPAQAVERKPVFAQVTAPHSYYWREMYAPHLTQGPSSLAWAPDGDALYFSIEGRIWRQAIASKTAVQITTGAGDAFQPDISPDGRSMVFAQRRGDAINLVVRDLKSGRETPLTDNDAVNLDPRWSPDGARIAYVTTAESGNFHIAIAERTNGAWASRRWRPARETADPRYYYAQEDHELSPAWSPDGEMLAFVSNADVLHGTGRIVAQRVDLAAAPIVIRDEETNWKARPDWSPEGARIAYSSYLGRQWRQLWMTTAEGGGYPIPFTYGDFDITAARWSPDGSKIAFVSNESGGLAIEIIDVVGGARRSLETADLKRRGDWGALRLSIRGADGEPSTARIQVRASDGRDYAPTGVWLHADDYRDPATGVETRYFHAGGEVLIEAPAGPVDVRVWRGLSTKPALSRVEIVKGREAKQEIVLEAIDADFSDWKSGDVHVHMNYGGAYRATAETLSRMAEAEALDLVFNLIVNKEQRIPDIAGFTPTPRRIDGLAPVLVEAQEFHTSIWGHLGFIGLQDHLLLPDYAGYAKTAVSSLYPDNTTIAKLARKQGALVGYVHPYDPPAPDPASAGRLSHALPVDAALGLVDYLEVVGFSDHRITEGVWHRLLNCGFRLPAAGGTDAMTNYASLRGPVGLDRTYVNIGAEAPADPAALTRRWLDGLKAGRSFATNSALLEFIVDGEGPGGDIRVKKGARKLKFTARMASIAPIDALDVVVNGEVVQSLPLRDDGFAAVAEGEIDIDRSSWISLRASGAAASADVFDLYPYAVTSPVYVTVDGERQRSRADADYFIAWIDRLIAYARASADFNTEKERGIVLAHFEKARREFERRR